MHKIKILCLIVGCFVAVSLWAEQATPATPTQQTLQQTRRDFKARRKQINKLVHQYKKAPANEQPAIKAQLEKLVSQGVDEGIIFMKGRIGEERARLDQWEKKIAEDEANLAQVKAQWVDDLLTGEAKKKHRQAKKRWKAQLKEERLKAFHK